MNRRFRLVFLPVLASFVASTIAVVTMLQKQNAENQPVFTQWTTPLFICLVLAAAISVLQAVVVFREEQRKSRRAVYRLRLQTLSEQPQNLKIWREDPHQVSGLLSLSVKQNDNEIMLLRRYIRYGELTAPSAPGEREYTEELADSPFSSAKDLRDWRLTLLFEPAHSDIKISSIYDREDLHDYILDAPVATNGAKRVLVLTEGFATEVPQLRSQFVESDQILVIKTNHRPSPDEVANFFNVIHNFRFEINGELVIETPLLENMLTYEYLIGGELADQYSKTLYYFGVATHFSLPYDKATQHSVHPIGVMSPANKKLALSPSIFL